MSLRDFLAGGQFYYTNIGCDNLNVTTINEIPIGNASGGIAGAISYTYSSPQTISGNTTLILGSVDTDNTFGNTSLTLNENQIVNSGTTSIFVSVSGFCVFSNSSGTGSSYALWINKNNSDMDRYGYTETADDNDYVTMNCTCSLQLAPNDYIQLRGWTNNSNTVQASDATFPGLRLTVAQLNQGSGSNNTQNLNEVLVNGNNAGNLNITNVGELSLNGYLNVGNNVNSDSAQIHMNYINGSSPANNYQLIATNDNLACQLYDNSGLSHQSLQLKNDGSVQLGDTQSSIPYVYVTSSSGVLGRVYDSHYNVPSSSGGGGISNHLALTSSVIQAVSYQAPYAMSFELTDSENTMGTVPITASANNTVFTNTSSRDILLMIDAHVIWSSTQNPTTVRGLYIQKNGKNTDIYGATSYSAGNAFCLTSTCTTILLNANDYFQLFCFHDDTGVTASANFQGFFTPGCRMSITQLM